MPSFIPLKPGLKSGSETESQEVSRGFYVSFDPGGDSEISQIAISSKIKHSKNVFAFTEQGVAMLSSVLNSDRAIEVNIQIMRAFVKLREMVASHKDLARKLDALEKKYDDNFKVVFEAIRALMAAAGEAQKENRFQPEGA